LRPASFLAVASLASFSVSCESTSCTEEDRSVWVELRSADSAPVCDASIRVTAQAEQADLSVWPPTDPCLFRHDDWPDILRAPEYTLEVSAPGYEPASAQVRTEQDECGHPLLHVVSGAASITQGSTPTVTVTLSPQ
jgi:hypothetical protein